MDSALSKPVVYALRGLQLVFAVIVLGTDGYGIHSYHGYVVHVKKLTVNLDFFAWHGVPNSWGFLIFCAVWTVLVVIFQLSVGSKTADRGWVRSSQAAAEILALLSWFSGFIAVAVNLGSESCGKSPCRPLTAATVFGAFEWLLFMITASIGVMGIFNDHRSSRPPPYSPAVIPQSKA